jgi:hypothetical protein
MQAFRASTPSMLARPIRAPFKSRVFHRSIVAHGSLAASLERRSGYAVSMRAADPASSRSMSTATAGSSRLR